MLHLSPVPTPCTVTSASWSSISNPVTEGTQVSLTVTGSTTCGGKQVSFKVRENDSIAEGGLDEDANFQPPNSTFNAARVATAIWKAERQNDCAGFCNPPEYFFNATVVGEGTPLLRSADPLLSVNPVSTRPISTPTPTPISNPGNITGTVSSSLGGAVSGATLTLTVNGSIKTYVTTTSGVYNAANIPAGTYLVKFQASGFISQDVTVTVSGTVTKNVTLVKSR